MDTSIIEVSVYPDRARVTRQGTVTLGVGTHHLEFAELPLTLVPDSVRASGRGSAAAVLLGVDTRRTYFTETPSIPVQELERQIEALNDEDKALADEAEAAQVQVDFIKSLADQSAQQFARGLAFGRTEVSQGETLIDFVQRQLAQSQARQREIQAKRRDLARQINKLNNDLNSYRSALPRERYTATVEVEVKTAGELTVDLIYMLGGAGWQAMYDIRLGEEQSPVLQLSYLGQITQNTGEDWENVALTLSTARPALASIQPELQPWYLSAYIPQPPSVTRSRATLLPMATSLAAAPMASGMEAYEKPVEMMVAAPPPVEMAAPEAQVSSNGASVTFKIAQPVTVPSDGAPHKVNVTFFDSRPELDFITVPKLAECAYRRAKVTNQSQFLLLAGQANLFTGGDYIGSMRLKQVAPNEEFELALGVDDRVYIKRELKLRDVDKKFLADRRRLRVGYEIEIRNLRSDPIKVEVHDQIPVPRHEQIKVKLESADPRPLEQSELNELEWQISLEPGARRFLRFDFSIEHPTSMEVMGLP